MSAKVAVSVQARGDGVLAGARRRGATTSRCGLVARMSRPRSTSSTRTPTTSRGSRCRPPSPRPTTPEKALPGPTWWCWRCPRRRCAATSPSGRRTSSADATCHGVVDEGRRARHAQRMSEVIAEVTGAGAGTDRGGQRAQPVPGDRHARARGVGRGLCRRGGRTARAGDCHSPAFRPYTSVDVLGCELGGAYKNVVALSVGMASGWGSATTPRPR